MPISVHIYIESSRAFMNFLTDDDHEDNSVIEENGNVE